MNDKEISGRCLCGTVRYRLASVPFDAGWCHCRTCQLNSGSPAMAFASVPACDYLVEAGTEAIGTVASSRFGHRAFCRECGTPLYMRADDQPGTIDFSLATLDAPDRVEPGFHIFYESRIAWAEAGDGLPRYARSRSEGAEITNGS